MSACRSRWLHKYYTSEYGIHTLILKGDMEYITASWGNQLKTNIDSWEILKIDGEGQGVGATQNLHKGMHIAIFEDVIIDQQL